MDVSVEAPAVEPEVQAREAQEDFAALLGAFVERFESELAGFLAAKADAAKAFGSPELGELTDALGILATHGGKRLRPALVYYSYRACGGPGGSSSGEPSDAAVLPVALAAELLHTYLLIHDDIMDHAEVRRGLPTAQVRFRELHRVRRLAGDGEDFGRSVAILLGDLAHSWAVELLAEAAAGSPHGRQLARCFATMCQEVVGGQYLELLVAERRAASEEELLRVLRLKSGRYSAERPIQLGAILAGAPAPTLAGLARYGAAVGEAFQLQDDLLGLFGDGETVGKPVDSDLKEGKYTFLIHHAMQAASPAERGTLEAALGKPDLSPDEAARALAIVETTGAKAQVMGMISVRLRQALAALDEVDGLTGEGRAFLAGLVSHLWERKR